MEKNRLTEPEREDIRFAAECVRSGGVIIYPTDTIWGIGCDAGNSAAVARVYALKGRAEAKAVISLVGSRDALASTVGEPMASIAERYMVAVDRPLTVIYPEAAMLCDEVKAADGSAAVRLTAEAWSAALCEACATPLVSTSANISGVDAPASFEDISEAILTGVDYVCSSRRYGEGACQGGLPSRIIKISDNGDVVMIRY